ncbi:MAG: hypothetical protein IPI41_10870 [Flavobacteriales bacterium]|nr:hypothetical protein [Flavobacteriales bacterium]
MPSPRTWRWLQLVLFSAFLALTGTSSVAQPYCDQAQVGPGFASDPGCEAVICGLDAYCCNTQWDGICAGAAIGQPACATCLSTYVPPVGCQNAIPFGTATPLGETLTTISTCSYLEEYSVINGILSGRNYEFTVSGPGGYITVRDGSVGGPILGSGATPLTVTTTSTNALYVHWNVDAACATETGICHTTTVQLLPPPACAPNGVLYPAAAVTPNANGTVTTINTCHFLNEYSQITGIVSGADYTFNSGTIGYITVRSGTPGGAVIGAGVPPLTVTAPDGNDIFPHWYVNAACATASGTCHAATVQRILVCTLPSATLAVVADCANNQFSIDVTVTSLGSATDVGISTDLLGVQHASVGLGTFSVGPFTSGASPIVTVIHNQDNSCNAGFAATNFTCPAIVNAFPYCENFELATLCVPGACNTVLACTATALNPVSWQQGSGDGGEWSVDEGGTSSGATGPVTGAGTGQLDYNPGTITGNYLYLESSVPCDQLSTPGAGAIALSPIFDVSGFTNPNVRATMAYHMLGATMGTMAIDIEDPALSNSWTTLWSQTGATGAAWFLTPNLDHPYSGTTVRYRVRGVAGSSFTSDMAFDYFCVSEGPLCTAPTANVTIDGAACPSFNLNVDVLPLGSAANVNISYTVNGGLPTSVGPYGTGVQVLGPFTSPDVVNVTIVHNSDAACNVPKGNFSGPSLCNDICSGAIVVTCASSPVNGTTVGATTEAVANCGAGNATPALGVWYRYVGDNQQVTLNTCAAPGFDSRLTVYSGTCGSLTCVVGNDDDNTCVVSGLRSAVTFTAFAGTDYYIMVHSFGEATQAAFVMNMSCSPLCLPVPGNDLCANAAPIVPSSGCVTTAGTTSCADATLGNPTCISGFATAPDVYYSFVAGDATQIINFSNITAANLGFAIYTACGGAQLACNGAVVNGGDNVVAGLINGAPYIMRVFSLQGQQGDFDVCIKNPCLPPTANVTPTYFNCASATPGQTDVLVDVLTVGGDPTVDVVINGVTVASGVGVGTYGPYSYGSGVSVDVDIVTDDTFCDLSFGPFINPSSCIICDGPTLNQTFCYGGPFAAGSTSWLYEAGGVGTFELNMYSGSVESNTWDDLTIYDGPDNTFPILFANGGTTDFSVNPFTVTATGSSLFMTLSWDTAVDCAGGSFTPLLWDVYCVNCDFVAGNVSNTNVDCGTSSYSFDVNVTDLGDAPDVDVVIDYPAPNTVAHNDVGLGTYSITGIPVGTPVAVLLQHNGNLACNDDLGVVNPTSNCIVCDNSILNEGPFCYGPNANQNWSYTSDGLGTMILNFSSGTVESNTWDDLTIYDGPDNTFPILFANPNATISLAGVQVVASGNALFMTLTADASVQCTSNVGWDWNWTVQCVDCTQPDGTVTVIENCGGGDFTLQVDVTDASNAGSVNILTDYLGDVEPSGVGLGTYVLGPYPSGTAVAVTLEHPNNVFCTLALGSFQDCCNGTCAGASAAVVGINANGEYNCGVPSNLFPVIGLTPNDARWWNYTPGVTERITVSACAPVNSTNTDTYVTVSTGPCASLGLHGGNDDECGLASSYTFQGTPGVEYHIEWDDRWGDDSAHDWELAVTPCVSPANDLCSSENPAASPVSIGSPQTFTGTRDCADKDGITNALTFPTIAGWVWESFELTQCANVTIDYCGTPGGTGNGALNMYGDCGTLFINSQTFAFNCDGNTNATITFTDLSPGFYYYPVLWDPNNNAQGAYTINVTAFAPTNPCPTNLTCATAIPMVCNDILLGNTNNQFPTLPANACAYPNSPISGGSLWYSYTPVVDENVVVSTCGAGSLFDTRLDVYTGVCGTLSCYNLSDDKGGACTTRSQLEFYAQAGQTYYIAVHSATPFIDGQFEIAIGCGAACVPPANDVCGSAIGLTTYLTDNTTFFPGVPTAVTTAAHRTIRSPRARSWRTTKGCGTASTAVRTPSTTSR